MASSGEHKNMEVGVEVIVPQLMTTALDGRHGNNLQMTGRT